MLEYLLLLKPALTIVFIIAAVVAAGLGILRSRKNDFGTALANILMIIASAIAAVLFANIIARLLSMFLTSLLLSFFPKEVTEIISSLPSGMAALRVVFSMILGPVLFLPVFAVVKTISGKLFTKPLGKVFEKLFAKIRGEKQEPAKEAVSAPECAPYVESTTVNEFSFESDNGVIENTPNMGSAVFTEENSSAETEAEPAQISGISISQTTVEYTVSTSYTETKSTNTSEFTVPSLSKKEQKLLDKEEAKKRRKFTLAASICGAVSGFLLLIILLVPTIGAYNAFSILDSKVDLSEITESEDMDDALAAMYIVSDALANNGGSVTFKYMGGNLLYGGLTTYSMNGNIVSLRREMKFLSYAVSGSADAFDDRLTTEARADIIRDIAAEFNKTTFIPVLASEFLSEASISWKNGDSYNGINIPSLGDTYDTLYESAYDVFTYENVADFKADVITFANIVATLIENDVFNEKELDPIKIMKNTQLTTAIFDELFENKRLSKLTSGIINIGFDTIGKQLGTPADEIESYENFIAEFGAILDASYPLSASERTAYLEIKFMSLFADYGLDFYNENIYDIVTEAADLFGDYNNAYLIKAFFAENYCFGKNFSNANEMSKLSTDITLKSIRITFTEINNPKEEAKIIASALQKAADLVNSVESTTNSTKLLNTIGPILDKFNESEMIGKKNTFVLLNSMLRSNTIRDSIGITRAEADNIALAMYDGLKTETYTQMLSSMKKTFDAIENNGGSLSNESISELMHDLTPASASILSKMTTPGVMLKQGVPENSAESVANSFSSLFANMSDAKENGMSDEKYASESEAVTNFINVAMSAGNYSDKSAFGEDSVTNKTASAFVDSVTESEIISKTLVETVYGDSNAPAQDPYNSQRNLSDTEKAELMQALDDKWAQKSTSGDTEEEKDEFRKTLNSIASIMNLEYNI